MAVGPPVAGSAAGKVITAMKAKPGVWFARGAEIARWYDQTPEARREVDFDRLAGK